jgi:hypothetical protein
MASSNSLDNPIPASYRVIYEAEFKTMYFDESLSTIITVWNANSFHITENEYKQDAEKTVKLIRNSQAKNMISDHRENKFNISPELQNWYSALIATELGKSGFEKCAVVINSDLNLLSALEEIRTNLAKMGNEVRIAYKFFNEFKEAVTWINSKMNN